MATNTVIVHPNTANTSSTPVIRLTITKLLAAVKQGNLEAVSNSLKTYGLPANGPKTTDYTVLQAALQRKHREIAKLLIEHNCNVNNPTENADYQSTPLYYAVSLQDDELVYMLLQKGAIIDVRDYRSGQSPAHLAAVNRLVNILWKLLHFNVNVNFGDSTGKSILQILLEQAVYHRRTPMETVNTHLVRKIMECKASLNFRAGPHGQTPLHLAALLPQRDILQIFLSHVDDLNHTDSEFNTVMHSLLSTKYACFATAQEQANLDIVTAMLHRGARPDVVNKCGQVPAHLAAKNRHLRVLLLLLQYERCINRVDHEGKTILHRLLEDFVTIDNKLLEQYRMVIKQIMSKGGRGDFLSTQGTTALHLAAQRSAKDANVLWLLVQGSSVNVNVKDQTGKTILHIIAKESNPNIKLVKLLMTKGLRADVKDDEFGTSPIQIAVRNKNMALSLELLPHISDINAVDDSNGNTLLHHLVQSSGNEKLVEILLQKGASVDIMNKRGLAPTFYAAETTQISLLLSLLRHSQDLAGQALMKDNQTNRTLLHLVLDASILGAEGLEVLRILLLNGAIVDQLDSRKIMPLHHKVLYSQPDLVDLLVANVSKKNLCGNEGRTLMHYLDKLPLVRIQNAEAQVIGLTKMLLNCGALLEGTNAQGKGILDLACRNKELLKIIIEYGQDVTTIVDAKNNSVLHTHLMDKVENRNLQTVTVLVKKGVSVEAQNKDGEAPLHLAAQNGELEILELLIEKAENVNLRDKRGNNVLHTLLSTKLTPPLPKTTSVDETTAVEENAIKSITSEKEKKIVQIIEKLVQKGLAINAINNAGETHLHLACRSYRMDACRYLLQSGAEPQICDKLGNGSLHFIAQAKSDDLTDVLATYQQEMVWYLMSRGCDANDKNHLGQTALHIAAKHGSIHVVEALVSSGADINCIDSVSRATPLHLAAASRRADVIGILVMCGADINSRQTDGSSVLQVVLRSPLKEDDLDDGLVFHLLELGADPEQQDNYGKTALHWACWNDRYGLKTLLDHGASLDTEDNWGFPPLHYATDDKIRVDAVLHLTKLKTAGIPISKKNDKFLNKLVEMFDLSEGIQSMHYEAEVNLLDQVLIDSKTTLHDFLRMDINTLSFFADNIVLESLISSEEFDTNFTHYGVLLKSRFNTGKVRKELLTAAHDNLSHLTGTPVPLTCSMKIFDPSFSNASLRCLIKAGTNARPSRKRRLSCNEDEERPAKQPRRLSV
ncbi:hypothetical protein TSAR_014511 [Trichomalopsis sarcophagae]|uniref:Uncharacterized protein n=1 Tax=Trichomalopsis sarcophagae TaxID=543379 RepID=A0A232F0W6_9HYME|nr:hypothetical protein TSAR_014511 [Trichomalopsis sarcophagae]